MIDYPTVNEPDPYNKTPRFCSRCGKKLKILDLAEQFDPYTGERVMLTSLSCPTFSGLHDRWKLEEYGAWVNYKNIWR